MSSAHWDEGLHQEVVDFLHELHLYNDQRRSAWREPDLEHQVSGPAMSLQALMTWKLDLLAKIEAQGQ